MSPAGKSLFASLLLHSGVVLAAAVALNLRPGIAARTDVEKGQMIACLITDEAPDASDADATGAPAIALPPRPTSEHQSPGPSSPTLAFADIPAGAPVDPIATAVPPSLRSVTVPSTTGTSNIGKASKTSSTVRRGNAGRAMAPAGEMGTGTAAYKPARYARCPAPLFPEGARKAGLSGTVLLYVEVNADGRPVSVAVRRSSGHEVLDSAAVRAVHEWRFEPARLGGRPVDARLEVPVRFAIS